MNKPILFILVSCLLFNVRGQQVPTRDSGILQTFHPNANLVIGIFVGMLSLTFILLLYLRFCHTHQTDDDFGHTFMFSGINNTLPQTSSGIDRTVIESIPFFQFSALKGSKEGLECAVCISKFEDSDILRLLPNCQHAFHMNCIDQWLERHSTCPLCRYKFDSKDLETFIHSNSLRLSRNPSNLIEDPIIELFVERESDINQVQGSLSSRFSISISSFRRSSIDKGKKQDLLIQQGESSSNSHEDDDGKILHKFKHKIIVSDFVIKNRWSDVSPSDFLSLNSEMLREMSSKRFSSLESNSSKMNNNHTQKRSMSEITMFPRVRPLSMKNQISNGGKEERIRRLWLPIVSKTVEWFSGQQRYSQNNRQSLNI